MKIPYNILIQIKMSVRPYFKGFTLIFFFYNCRKQEYNILYERVQKNSPYGSRRTKRTAWALRVSVERAGVSASSSISMRTASRAANTSHSSHPHAVFKAYGDSTAKFV